MPDLFAMVWTAARPKCRRTDSGMPTSPAFVPTGISLIAG